MKQKRSRDISDLERKFRKDGGLTAVGSATGAEYWIDECDIVPTPPAGDCIDLDVGMQLTDSMQAYARCLAIKLLIETDEREFERVSGRDGCISRSLFEQEQHRKAAEALYAKKSA